MSPQFVVVVPVKPPARGKSRLVGLTDSQRADLARAFALDTVAACRQATTVAQILVVTDDAAFASDPDLAGCHTVPDGTTQDLNAALVQAAAEAHRRWPEHTPVALCADLPALLPAELDQALHSLVPGGASFVADASGLGTTLYTAPYTEFAPEFGVGSCAAHRASGALEVAAAGATLRRDVDDLKDLTAAISLGLGVQTRSAVSRLDLG